MPEELAEAAASSVAGAQDVATKLDIAELKADLIKWMVGLHAATWLALIGAVIAVMGRLP